MSEAALTNADRAIAANRFGVIPRGNNTSANSVRRCCNTVAPLTVVGLTLNRLVLWNDMRHSPVVTSASKVDTLAKTKLALNCLVLCVGIQAAF